MMGIFPAAGQLPSLMRGGGAGSSARRPWGAPLPHAEAGAKVAAVSRRWRAGQELFFGRPSPKSQTPKKRMDAAGGAVIDIFPTGQQAPLPREGGWGVGSSARGPWGSSAPACGSRGEGAIVASYVCKATLSPSSSAAVTLLSTSDR
jgi:hypothetical protein